MRCKIIFIFFLLFFVSAQFFAQTVQCDGTLPFEEKDGILTIEMESGTLPAGSDWKTGSEPDPNLSVSTINYIFWDGSEFFNSLTNASITYNIKINNPGTYKFRWRGRIGFGTSGGEHNDAWLKIEADDFFATKTSSPSSTEVIEPRPSCGTNPDRDCPEGSSTGGFFKAFMNRHPVNLPVESRWGFVTNANDKDAFKHIWATFNAAGNYSIVVNARSNRFFIDKMVLRRTDVSDAVAFNLNNPESSCFDASLATSTFNRAAISIHPNPTTGNVEIKNLPLNSKLVIRDILGATVRVIQTKPQSQNINISDLKNGVYFISNTDQNNRFVKKLVKI